MDLKEFRLERYFARWEFVAPHLLSSSDCESMTVGELLALGGADPAELLDLRLGYTDSQGDPELRARIAGLYPGLGAEDILVAAPQEAIFLAMTALVAPGDRVIVQTPCYQSLTELAAWRGADVVSWPMVETETGWRIDLDRLRALVTPKTNLLVINFPHNPTGALPTPAEMDAIVELCESRGVWLFSDEMYRGLEHDAERRLAPAVTRSARALSLWGLSKSFGLPGLRIGWLAVRDKRVLAEMQKLKDYTTICSSGPSERLARVALDAHELLMRRNLAIIKDNLVHARDFVDRWPELLAWREPAAGPIAFLRLLRGGAHQFCDHAAERAGVMIVPSTVFDFGDAHIRIGLGRKHFPLALSALEGYLPRD